MKSRVSFFLMEQLLMLLVFALAAAACLGIFVAADRISRETELLDAAVLLAQNGAEAVKASASLEEAAATLGGSITSEGLNVQSGTLCLTIQPLPTTLPGLYQARSAVFFADALLFSLDFAWQEVS